MISLHHEGFHLFFNVTFSWMIKYSRPILIQDSTLLVQRPCNHTDNVHSPAGGPGTGDEFGTAHGLVAVGRGSFIRSDLKVVHAVRHDTLKEDKDTIVSGTEFVDGPTGGAGFRKTNFLFVAVLDRISSTQEGLFGAILGGIRQIGARRPLQSQVVPGGTSPTCSTMHYGKVGSQGIFRSIKCLNDGIRAVVVPSTDRPIVVVDRIESGKCEWEVLLDNLKLMGRPNVDNHQEQKEGICYEPRRRIEPFPVETCGGVLRFVCHFHSNGVEPRRTRIRSFVPLQ